MAAAAVARHEQEHVRHEQANAAKAGRTVVVQTVNIHTDVCPECGRAYVSGGETTTMTKGKDSADKQPAEKGLLLDLIV